jgi:raffinose/stachyose/melibiose transport system substrate-binding protein
VPVRLSPVRHRSRRCGAWGIAIALCLLASACSLEPEWDDDIPLENAGSDEVTLTWWHIADSEPTKGFFEKVAAEFHEKNPKVTVEIVIKTNEELTEDLSAVQQTPDAPDVYQQWGGGKLVDQLQHNYVMDLTQASSSWVGDLGATVNGWQTDGKLYGIPYTLGIVGFWYNKATFAKAGITAPPATWKDFLAVIARLKAAGIAPISLGAKDKWPTAFFYDYLAVRECSQEVLEKTVKAHDFSDPCWLRAGEYFKQLIAVRPFQTGFLKTPAQESTTSATGLLANGKAAMELQGHWEASLLPERSVDKKGPGDDLGWFPFPEVPGGKGPAGAALGGGDGFSCSASAPKECTSFLEYLVSKEVQSRFAALNVGPPTNRNAASAMTDANLKTLVAARDKAPFIQTYLDVAFGTTIGNALNDAVSLQVAGLAKPAAVVEALQHAAGNK